MMPDFINVLRKRDGIAVNKREFPNAQDGDGVIVTYSFMTSVPTDLWTDVLANPYDGFERYSAAEKKIVEKSLKAWSSVANVIFVKTAAPDADLRFGKHNMPYKVNGYAGGLTYNIEKAQKEGAEIWLDWKGFVRTAYGKQIVTHEIGHSLGLAHPFVGKGGLKKAEFGTSIMATNLWGDDPYKGHPTKLGVIDTAAIQSIYGPAHKKLGNNIYKVGDTKLIWDGGGVDTMSASAAKAKAYLDMNDGSWSWVGRKLNSILGKGQTWLGHFTDIEKAIGSRYADTIIGNELDNTIQGGAGNDTIAGGAGSDALYGGAGQDTFVFTGTADLGSVESPDIIADFETGDRIDMRMLELTFRGEGTNDTVLNAPTGGQFYVHTSLKQLRFDIDADGAVDHIVSISGASVTGSALIL